MSVGALIYGIPFSRKLGWKNPLHYNKNHQSSLILNGQNWPIFSTKMLNCNIDIYNVSKQIQYYFNKYFKNIYLIKDLIFTCGST